MSNRVTPEWEAPGHDTSIVQSHSEVVACASLDAQSTCFEAPCGFVNLGNAIALKRAGELYDGIYGDSLAAFTDSVVHVSGDEVSSACFGGDTDGCSNTSRLCARMAKCLRFGCRNKHLP